MSVEELFTLNWLRFDYILKVFYGFSNFLWSSNLRYPCNIISPWLWAKTPSLYKKKKKTREWRVSIWTGAHQFKTQHLWAQTLPHTPNKLSSRANPTSSINVVLQYCTCAVLILLSSIYSQPKSRQICTALELRLAPSVLQKQFAAQTCLWRSVLEWDRGKQRLARATK